MTITPADDQYNETGHPIHHADTAKDVRALLNKAKSCAVHVVVSRDVGINVETSKAAIRRALSEFEPNEPAGGILWESNWFFCLDLSRAR